WIYIAGHTDYSGTARSNYSLSEGRAKFVADIIRRHLDGQHLIEGRDYRLHIERRGDAECPQHGPKDDPDYRKTCRQIVIRFQHAVGEPIAANAEAPRGH